MIQILKSVSKKIGIDGAIGYTVLSRIITTTGGLITLIFIALFLSTEEQGYYYTFGSIIAIQIFFELGLNGIITQYAAHEVAHLKWESKTKLTGDIQHLSRLASLLHLCIKIFIPIAFILFIVLIFSGHIFFSRFHHGDVIVSWQQPYMLLAFSISLMFLINPVLAFIEGLGKVKEVAMLRLIQQLINVLTIAVILVVGGKLWALGSASLISVIILSGGIIFTYKIQLLKFIYQAKHSWIISYRKEIFPYQWKIALSFISGYFIFQLFNPVLFATEGPVVAGQMGMTLAALNGISSLSMSWITTKIPTFSQLIALKNYTTLDRIFNKTLKQLSVINLLFLGVFILGIYLLNYLEISLANRFLPIIPIILLCMVTLSNQFVFSWATYLRCHKEEPFLLNSIVGGILCALSTVFLGKYYGLYGIVIGYTILTILVGLTWGFLVFRAKKLLWHG